MVFPMFQIWDFCLVIRAELSTLSCTGVAVGTEVCNPESPPLTDPTLWTFTIGMLS